MSYLEAAYLLLHGDLPSQSALDSFESRVKGASGIPAPLVSLLGEIPPGNHPMDVLRTSVSVLAHFDPEVNAAPTDHAATSGRPSGCSPRCPPPSPPASGSARA